MKETLLGKDISELQVIAIETGMPKFGGRQLAEWLYKKRVKQLDEMSNISQKHRAILSEKYTIGITPPVKYIESSDGTKKYLFKVNVGDNKGTKQYIESVYIPDGERATLCVSTQAGCKMGCKFCMTGRLGFHGQLSAGDILNQILAIPESKSLTNIVFMGEGEPLDNIDNVLKALNILTSEQGCGWSPKRITVSSVGLAKNIRRLLDETECHIAISLHNPIAEQRAEIMPIEKASHIADVLDILREYDFRHQRRLSFEYICFSGLNDTHAHAKALLRLLNGLSCRINLIRYHTDKTLPPESQLLPSSNEERMIQLRDYLSAKGIATTIRRSRGEDILAACGMLVAKGV